MSDNDAQVYKDLVTFLGYKSRNDIIEEALKATEGVTDYPALVKYGAIPPLCSLLNHPNPSFSSKAATILLRTSACQSSQQAIEDLVTGGKVGNRVLDLVLSFHHPVDNNNDSDVSNQDDKSRAAFINDCLAILVNVTRLESGTISILRDDNNANDAVKDNVDDYDDEEPKEGQNNFNVGFDRALPLISRFIQSSPSTVTAARSTADNKQQQVNDDGQEEVLSDPYQHCAGILMNISQLHEGRKFIMSQRHNLLKQILPELTSTNKIRRRGVAGMIKNICFEKDSAWWLINEIQIVKWLLYPLAGPEEIDIDDKIGMDPSLWMEGPDKKREEDEEVRLLLVESLLLLLATGRKSRESLRVQRTYVILKQADMVEESEQVGEKINECVQFLRRDEHGTEEGSSDAAIRLALPQAAPSIVYGNTEDFDDVD